MATNRSRRLRKKLCVDEFQELGFEVNLTYRDGIEAKAVDDFLEAFLNEAIEANWPAAARSTKNSVVRSKRGSKGATNCPSST